MPTDTISVFTTVHKVCTYVGVGHTSGTCQLCFVFVSCVHRRVVEGSGEGSAGCVVHVDVHGECVMLWVAAM